MNKVFISDKLESLIPAWLRFIPGVVDTVDLSLNISREILQNNAVINKISTAITKRILKELSELKKKKPEEFLAFWKNFGPVIKEGLYEFNDFHDQIFDFSIFRTFDFSDIIILLFPDYYLFLVTSISKFLRFLSIFRFFGILFDFKSLNKARPADLTPFTMLQIR